MKTYERLYQIPDERFVKILIFISSFFKTNETAVESLSPELLNYKRKIEVFLQIQEIEKVMREYAIDNFINYHKMESILDKPTLEGLSFKPAIEFKPENIKVPDYLDNYYTDNYVNNEVDILIIVIKKLFSHRPIWLYEDLVKEIKDPSIVYDISYDHTTFSESSIVLALNFMLQGTDIILNNITDITYNTQIPYIILNNEIRNIVYIEPYYMLVPVDNIGVPLIDYNQWFIPNVTELDTSISLTKFWTNVLVKDEIREEANKMLKVYKDNYYLSLIEVHLSVHQYLAKEIIKDHARGVSSKYSTIEKVYKDMKYLLYKKDFINKEVLPKLKMDKPNSPIGYRKGLKCFIYINKEFQEMSSNLFFNDERKENNKLIGFFKLKQKRYEFLLRKPLDQLVMYSDRRKIQHGSACTTYTARQRSKFADLLNIKTDILDDICYDIKMKMLKREMNSRIEDRGSRWLYMPWEVVSYILYKLSMTEATIH